MSVLKKTIALIFVFAFVISFASCGKSEPGDVVHLFLDSIKMCDVSSASGIVYENVGFERYADIISSLDDYSVKVLRSVYAFISYSVISDNVIADEYGGEIVISDNENRIVRLNMTIPDFSSLLSLTVSESAFSPMTKTEILEKFVSDGTVGKYLTSYTIDVELKKINGEWKLPFSQKDNKQLYDALMLYAFAYLIIN